MPYSLPRRRNVFHFNNDQDSSSDEEDSLPLKLKTRPTSFHGPPAAVVPFQRTNSTPNVNGKPLKSSLKSFPPPGRTRASSTPSLHKNVHFPSNHLATVCFYSRSARPASLSLADGADTETETETEKISLDNITLDKITLDKIILDNITLDTWLSSPVPAASPAAHANVHLESLTLTHASSSLALKGTLLVRNLAYEKTVAVRFTLDEWHTTSEVLAHYTASLPALPPAFYVPGSGLQRLPPTPRPIDNPAWDRFTFSIRLDDYAHSLATRTLWLVVRYCIPTTASRFGSAAASASREGMRMDARDGGEQGSAMDSEWWDNNGGSNYRIAFKHADGARPLSTPLPLPLPLPPRTVPPPPPPPLTLATTNTTLPLPTPSPSSSPTAQYSRLRSLSLTNYAAPTSVSPTSPSSHLHERERDHDRENQTHASPSLTATSDGSPCISTPVDIMGTRTMEMVNGFPATGPSGLGFGLGLGLDMGFGAADATDADDRKEREEDDKDQDQNKDNDKGDNAHGGLVSLYWPWGRHDRDGGHVEYGHLPTTTTTKKKKKMEKKREVVGVDVRRYASPSPSLSVSDSNSSGSGSSSGEGEEVGKRRVRVGRRVFSSGSGDAASASGVGDKEERERVYEAIVRKWCFAGPQHQYQHQHQHQGRGRGDEGMPVH